tara:strand:+ start:2619 stop:4991 length:2373 start_codon:yes stop_codon:yes gene_type:complete
MSLKVTFIEKENCDIKGINQLLLQDKEAVLVISKCTKPFFKNLQGSSISDKIQLVKKDTTLKSGKVYLIPEDLPFGFNGQAVQVEKSFTLKWEDLSKSTQNELYLLDSDFKILDTNKAAVKNLKFPLRELKNAYVYDVLTRHSKKSLVEMLEPIQAGQQERITFECIHTRADKTTYPVECTISKLSNPNENIFLYKAVDITKQKEILQVSETHADHLQTLANNFPEGSISLFDSKLNLLFTGGEGYSKYGMDPSDLIGLNARDFLKDQNYQLLLDAKKKVVTASSFSYETTYKDQHFRNTLKPIYGKKGFFRYYVLTSSDNTKFKEQQSELLIEKNNFAAINNALDRSALVSITDKKGVIVHANKPFCDTSKYKLHELIGNKHNIVNSGYHSRAFWKDMWMTVNKGNTWRSEVKNKAKDGTYYWVDTVINPIIDIDGKIANFLSVRYLITERKELEFNLLQITNKFVLASQAAGIGVWTFDFDTLEVSWDIQIQGISELGFFKGSFEDWLQFLHPMDRELISQTLNPENLHATEFELETRVISTTGQQYHINLKASIESREGKSKRAIGLTWDVSREKKVQQNLEEALEDREVMYKELHHRIKNNLQMVNSLLYIRGTHTTNEELREFIKDTSTKINSISAIHEKLLQLSPMNQLKINDYLVTLCDNIVKTYSDRKRTFSLDINVISELFDVDTALNIGLIINEILSNTIKYAYPEEGGLIIVSLHRQDDQYILRAKDKGVGISDEKRANLKSSYGMQLIELFVRQIDGKMKIQHQNGTSYTIRFKKPTA